VWLLKACPHCRGGDVYFDGENWCCLQCGATSDSELVAKNRPRRKAKRLQRQTVRV